jgi:L-lactate utilization protein LutB
MAPFMIIGRKIANNTKVISLKLTAVSEKCIHCHRCTEHCPMSLPVEAMVESKKWNIRNASFVAPVLICTKKRSFHFKIGSCSSKCLKEHHEY